MLRSACRVVLQLCLLTLALDCPAFGQGATTASEPTPSPAQPAAETPPPVFTTAVTVVGTAPLPGGDMLLVKVPKPVQVLTIQDVEAIGALDLTDLLN